MYHWVVGQLNWAFELIDVGTKLENASINDFIKALKNIQKLKQSNTKIFYPIFNSDPHFSDAVHANLNDGVISVGTHTIVFVDNQSNSCQLTWQANKIKLIVCSTFASEALSLQEAIEHAIFLR